MINSSNWILVIVTEITYNKNLKMLTLLIKIKYSRCLLLLFTVIIEIDNIYNDVKTVN